MNWNGELADAPADQEILGWRAWRLGPFVAEPHPDTLVSCHRPTEWDGPVLRADRPPQPNSTGGIYCWRDDLEPGAVEEHDAYRANWPVSGLVALSGRVVVCERGYRAEVATIRRLVLHPSNLRSSQLDGLADRLARRYGCEVHTETARERDAWQVRVLAGSRDRQWTELMQRYPRPAPSLLAFPTEGGPIDVAVDGGCTLLPLRKQDTRLVKVIGPGGRFVLVPAERFVRGATFGVQIETEPEAASRCPRAKATRYIPWRPE